MEHYDKEGENFYQILGIPVDSSPDAIKKAWKILVRKYHPDKVGYDDFEEKARAGIKVSKINEAYSILSEPSKRKYYDLYIGVKDAKCSKCGGAGKLTLDADHRQIAICNNCITWTLGLKL
jgi:curved DNA-binding protein CbpA